ADWETPSKTKWSLLMEDIFGKETPSGVTMVFLQLVPSMSHSPGH
ncbi:ZNF317 isoform 1, partial [Pan troglodytes]